MHWFFVLFIIVFVAAFIGGAYISHYRTKALKALAPQLGLSFLGDGKSLLPSQVWSFELFSKGRSRQATNVLSGHLGDAQVYVFDYRYTTGSGSNSRQTHYYTVALIQSDTLNLPTFRLVPEHLFHKIGQMFGYKDIDFQADPEFSKRYLLRGSSESAVRQMFDSRVTQFYKARRGACTEGLGNTLIFYYAQSRRQVKLWPSLLSDARQAAALMSPTGRRH